MSMGLIRSLILSQRCLEIICVSVWAIGLIFLTYVINGEFLGIDDADIFFAYAQNFVERKELFYSAGIPSVEGYTSFLWMLLSSVVMGLGFDKPEMLLLNLIIFILSQIIVFRILEQVSTGKQCYQLKVLYCGILTGSFGYLAWTTITLMDTGLWSLFIAAMSCYLILPPKDKTGWVVASLVVFLSPWVRPEAFVLTPVFLLLIYLREKSENKRSSWAISFMAFIFLTSCILITWFRLSYFGFPLPNTFYAKVSNSWIGNLREGARYLFDYFRTSPLAGLSFVMSICLVMNGFFALFSNGHTLQREDRLFKPTFLISVVVLVGLCLPLLTGGDHFSLSRFYQPFFPLIACQLVLFFYEPLPFQIKRTNYWFLGGLLFWVLFLSSGDNLLYVLRRSSPLKFEFILSKNGRLAGDNLNRLFSQANSKLPSVGVIAAGGIAVTYKGTIYDLMGLNNSFIAHFKGERKTGPKNHAAFQRDAFFQLPIDLLVLPLAVEDPFVHLALKGLFYDERFIGEWIYGTLREARENGEKFEGFFNKKFIEKTTFGSTLLFKEVKRFDVSKREWIYV